MTKTLHEDLQVIMLLLFAAAMQECQRAAEQISAGTLSPEAAEQQVAEQLAEPMRHAIRDMLRAYLRDKLLERAP